MPLQQHKNINFSKELVEGRELPYELQDDWSIRWVTDDIPADIEVEMPLIKNKPTDVTTIKMDEALWQQIDSNVAEEEKEKEEDVKPGTTDTRDGAAEIDGNTAGESIDLHKALNQQSNADNVSSFDMSGI